MFEAFVNGLLISGWVLLYLAIGWVFALVDIVYNFMESEEEIAISICLWPLCMGVGAVKRLCSVVAIGMRATERLGTKIRNRRRG